MWGTVVSQRSARGPTRSFASDETVANEHFQRQSCAAARNQNRLPRVTGEFDLDHFLPQATHPDRTGDYDKLLYACRAFALSRVLAVARVA